MQYYVRSGSENLGPFSLEDLQSRGITPETFVWYEGRPDWLPASEIPELQGILVSQAMGTQKPPPGTPKPDETPAARLSRTLREVAIKPPDAAHPYASPAAPLEYGRVPGQGNGPAERHSGFGIASLVLGIGVAVILLVAMVVATVAVMDDPNIDPEQSPPVIVAACSLLIGILLNVVGVILGIVGVVQSRRKKAMSIAGLVINGLILFGVLGLIAVGMALGG